MTSLDELFENEQTRKVRWDERLREWLSHWHRLTKREESDSDLEVIDRIDALDITLNDFLDSDRRLRESLALTSRRDTLIERIRRVLSDEESDRSSLSDTERRACLDDAREIADQLGCTLSQGPLRNARSSAAPHYAEPLIDWMTDSGFGLELEDDAAAYFLHDSFMSLASSIEVAGLLTWTFFEDEYPGLNPWEPLYRLYRAGVEAHSDGRRIILVRLD